jgi:hypothetical protein
MKYFIISFALVLIISLLAFTFDGSAGTQGLKFPEGYRSWTHVKSMLIHSEEHPLYNPFGGLHHVYVNDTGLKTMKSGGTYPDGSVLVFDLYDTKEADGAFVATERKFIGVMVKDGKKYKEAGGWGWDVFPGDSRTGGNVADAKKECFSCHSSETATDFVFSRYQQ